MKQNIRIDVKTNDVKTKWMIESDVKKMNDVSR